MMKLIVMAVLIAVLMAAFLLLMGRVFLRSVN
jgi:hypothetical protein